GLDNRLPAVLQDKDKPQDSAERLGFAHLCQRHRHRYAAATRFYAEAFAEQPALAARLDSHRYNAACAAALAGCGQGEDAAGQSPAQLLAMRLRALTWLRADLDGWRRLLEKGPDTNCQLIARKMQHWQADLDFAGVRGKEALARLPEAERQAWQKLWAGVAGTLARAQAKGMSAKKPLPAEGPKKD